MLLAIESASDEPGVALAREGTLLHAATWTTRQNHSRELLPAIERLLTDGGAAKADINAIAVDIGPGGYAALRVGVSIAKALAHALRVPLAGIGRLELDAWLARDEAGGRRIAAVHAAGRGEAAVAAYRSQDGGWREEAPPRLCKRAELPGVFGRDDVATGDIDDALARELADAGIAIARPGRHRVEALAELAALRLSGGRTDDPAALVPLYLRAPAIGAQGG